MATKKYHCLHVFCVAVLFCFLFHQKANAQETPLPDSSAVVKTQDTVPHVMDTFRIKKKFWRASGELLLVEVVPWAYNYYVRDADFAKISWESIKHNIQFSNWEWDDNSFKTNQFAHPYHGNLYFNSFRTNGYSFWQSAPAALMGSYLWEVAGETHPASPNDWINTTLGGISLGEMTFRLSNHIINNKQRGFTRQMQEVFGFLLNPVGGLNRILDGRWGRVHYTEGDEVRTPITGLIDVGARRFSSEIQDVFARGDNEAYLRLRLRYGNAEGRIRVPFSSFYVNVEAGASDSAYLNNVAVSGILQQWIMKETEEKRHLSSITMDYNYFLNNSFEYGGQSFNYRIVSDWNRKSRTQWRTNIGAGLIVLAAVPDDYLYYGEGRNYDYGPGLGYNAGVMANFGHKFFAIFDYRGGWFRTVNGNKASFYLNVAAAELRYFLNKRFSLNTELGTVSLNGNYRDYPDVKKHYPYGKLSVGYTW